MNNFSSDILNDKWIGNLEGSLIQCDDAHRKSLLSERIVFNDLDGIRHILDSIPFCSFSIANNHIKDAASIYETTDNIRSLGLEYVGAGQNLKEAGRCLQIKDGDSEYLIISSGWDLIKCPYATNCSEGVNPYDCTTLLNDVASLNRESDNKRIVVFMHWNYELELYPQPMDRDFAHALIDEGAYAVIGCHSHRVQPLEIYKGHPIVYSLGNFLFKQKTYMDGNLVFPDFSYPEIAFQITDDGHFVIHDFIYSPSGNTLSYLGPRFVCSSDLLFQKLNSSEYLTWFKQNRFQKKALPIFIYDDAVLVRYLKRVFVKFRVRVVDFLAKNQFLFHAIKTFISKIFR